MGLFDRQRRLFESRFEPIPNGYAYRATLHSRAQFVTPGEREWMLDKNAKRVRRYLIPVAIICIVIVIANSINVPVIDINNEWSWFIPTICCNLVDLWVFMRLKLLLRSRPYIDMGLSKGDIRQREIRQREVLPSPLSAFLFFLTLTVLSCLSVYYLSPANIFIRTLLVTGIVVMGFFAFLSLYRQFISQPPSGS